MDDVPCDPSMLLETVLDTTESEVNGVTIKREYDTDDCVDEISSTGTRVGESEYVTIKEEFILSDKEDEEGLEMKEVTGNNHDDEEQEYATIVDTVFEYNNDEELTQNENLESKMSNDTSQQITMTAKGINRPYHCDVCNKSFGHLKTLKDHKNLHTGLRPYKCQECGKCFTQGGHLRAHLNIHRGIKPHKCKECGKSFSDSSKLKRHTYLHNGNFPHHCKICNKSFPELARLKSHLFTHTKDSPYQCDICKKTFTRIYHLQRHNNLHTKEKMFTCELCKKEFNRNSNLKSHINNVHNKSVDNLECYNCKKKFVRPMHYTKHKLKCKHRLEKIITKKNNFDETAPECNDFHEPTPKDNIVFERNVGKDSNFYETVPKSDIKIELDENIELQESLIERVLIKNENIV